MKNTTILILSVVTIAVLAVVFVASALALTPPLNSFTSGQVSPHLEGRTDYPKYHTACRVMENFLVTAQGPATKRPGTEYITDPNDPNDTVVRLIPFVYSTDDSYVLELVDGEMRFMRTVNETSGVIQQ